MRQFADDLIAFRLVGELFRQNNLAVDHLKAHRILLTRHGAHHHLGLVSAWPIFIATIALARGGAAPKKKSVTPSEYRTS